MAELIFLLVVLLFGFACYGVREWIDGGGDVIANGQSIKGGSRSHRASASVVERDLKPAIVRGRNYQY